MVYQSGTDTQKQPALKHAIKSMPGWKWRLLTLGLVVGMIGVGGQVYGFFRGENPRVNAPVMHQATAAPSASPAPMGSRGFVSGQPASTDTQTAGTPAADSTQQSPPDYSQLWKPFMTRVGFSLFVGIFVGVVFRAFLRTAMMISVAIIGGAMALRYFNVVNVDLTAVKTETAQATNWFADQGYRVKDMLFHALPSTTSAGIGFILGLKRR
jgi:uncharacterized membrane protein (Fun14 family)